MDLKGFRNIQVINNKIETTVLFESYKEEKFPDF